MDKSYWTSVLSHRLSRRRALTATGAGAAAAAIVAACGGGEEKGGGDKSKLLWAPADETKKAKAGGTYVSAQTNAPSSLDPHIIGAHVAIARRAYSQLFRIKYGVLQNTAGEFAGDLAQSWELSPDKLTLTVKLEPQAGFAPLAPVNGRLVDSEDVTFSWARVEKSGTLRGDLANSVSPAAPIVSIQAPDKQTLVFNLKEPNATIFTLLGHDGLGSLWIVPKEAADTSKLDLKGTVIGTGPYAVTEARTDSNFVFKRNENFKRSTLKSGEPYIAEIRTPVIVDPATLLSQFRAGAIYETDIKALDVVPAKKDLPDLLMYVAQPPVTERVYFGQNPDSPFIDQRLRQAYYRVIDRDAYVKAAYNTDKYTADGLPVQEFWGGSFEQASWGGGWVLDPKSTKDYGEFQKNFVFNIAEAKKLIEAAGQKVPFDFVQVRSAPGPTSFPQPIYDRMQIIEGMVRDSSAFTFKFRDLQWATEWSPQIRQSKGKFSGTSWGPDTSSFDPSFAAFFVFNPAGGYFEGGDSTLEQMTLNIRREFDVEKRKLLVRELQKYDADKMFNQKLGVAAPFRLTWPVVRNVGVFIGGTNWLDISTGSELKAWLDETKAPLKKA